MFEVEEEIIMYAFRYALGRRTYSVKDVSDCIIDNWHRLQDKYKERIIEEIEVAIQKNQAGDDCDVDRWKAVLLLEKAVKED